MKIRDCWIAITNRSFNISFFIFDLNMAYPHVIYNQRHSSSLLLTSVLCLLSCTGGNCLVVFSPVGDDAVLPCETDPPSDPDVDLAIHWTTPDVPPLQYVHFQRNGKEVVDLKYSSYKNRTSLFNHEVQKGNVSLKLSRVNSSDEGNYTCHIDEVEKECIVQLIVGSGATGHESTTKAPDDGSPQDGHVGDPKPSATGAFPWWGYLIIVVFLIFGIISICLVVFKEKLSNLAFFRKFLRRKKTDGNGDRSKDGVSELSPMNRVSVDQMKVIDGASTALM